MIGEGIHEEVLRALVEQRAVRECLVARRTWASLTAVGRFAESVGLNGFSVEL